MKKTVGIALVGIAMLANGCTSGSSTGTSASGGAAAPKNNNVALVLGVKGSPFYEAMACGAQAKAQELGLTLTVSAGAQFAADAQIRVGPAAAPHSTDKGRHGIDHGGPDPG